MDSAISFTELLAYSEQETRQWKNWFSANPEALDVSFQIANAATVRGLLGHIFVVELVFAHAVLDLPYPDRLPISNRILSDETDIPRIKAGIHQLEQLVLVRVIEIAKDGQQWRNLLVWSVVRLRQLNSCSNRLANTSETSTREFPVKVRPAICDGESKLAFLGERIRRSLVTSNSIDEMVERVPEIMQSIRVGGRRPSASEVTDTILGPSLPAWRLFREQFPRPETLTARILTSTIRLYPG